MGSWGARLSGAYMHVCQRLAGSGEPCAMRMAGSCLLLPVLLLATALACGVATSLNELAVLVISLAGLAMIMCALALFGLPAHIAAMANFIIYGFGLATIGMIADGDSLSLLMTALLPIEIWLVTRKAWPAVTGLAAAVLIDSLLILWTEQAALTLSAAAIVVFVAYAALIGMRIARATGKGAEQTVAEPVIMHQGGDVRFSLDLEGRIMSADVQTARRLGAKADGLKDAMLLDHVHVTDRVHYLSMLADLREGKAVHAVDLRLRARNKDRVVFEPYRIEAFVHADRIALTGRSLQREQELQDEIAALKAELARERVNKSHQLAAISHELRTPLNAIIGFSDMLANGIGSDNADDRQREYAGIIHRSGHYMLELVNAVLDSSRLETGTYRIHPKSFAFRQAVDLCSNVMLPQAEAKGVVFCHRVRADIGELVADQRAVQQILINLAANAVKFTKKGGCVTIDAARIATDSRPMLEISITDTGIGMSEDDLARIGTPFMRADNSYTRAQEGSGLGLCVVKGLVALHEGSIKFKSRLGEGTVVTVRLPLAGPLNHTGGTDNHVACNEQLATGMVIDMHRHQGERHNDWQKDGNQDQVGAQTRKTA